MEQNDQGGAPVRARWRHRVLITEDNGALRQLMAEVLQREGCCVTEAVNAVEMRAAIQRAAEAQHRGDAFDLIVADIFMPGKTGLDALSELRRSGLRSQVLVVTAFPEAATQHRIVELGASLLAKPFSLGEFRSVTTKLLPPRGGLSNAGPDAR